MTFFVNTFIIANMKKKSVIVLFETVLFAILVYLNASILALLVKCYQKGVGLPDMAFYNPEAWVTYIVISVVSLVIIVGVYILILVLTLKRKK